MKKLLSVITAIAMIFCFFPPVRSFAADPETVRYIAYEPDGKGGYIQQEKSLECTVIDSSRNDLTLESGYYAIKYDVKISNRIKISGNVHLILTDGCKLDATQGIYQDSKSKRSEKQQDHLQTCAS